MHTITIIVVSVIKRGERGLTAAFQITSAVLIIKNKSPTLFLDLSHDRSCLTESMPHCWHQWYEANRTSVERVRYILPSCVVMDWSVCGATVDATGQQQETSAPSVSSSSCEQSCVYILPSVISWEVPEPGSLSPSGILSYNSSEQKTKPNKKQQRVNKHTVLLTLRLLVKEFFTSIRSGWGIRFLLLIPAAAAWCGFWSASLFFKQSAPWVNFSLSCCLFKWPEFPFFKIIFWYCCVLQLLSVSLSLHLHIHQVSALEDHCICMCVCVCVCGCLCMRLSQTLMPFTALLMLSSRALFSGLWKQSLLVYMSVRVLT